MHNAIPTQSHSGLGIAALTISAARDLADKQIRVMTIAPGVMETPMMAGLPEKARTTLETLVPHPARLGRPSEYALLVEQLIANPLLNGIAVALLPVLMFSAALIVLLPRRRR